MPIISVTSLPFSPAIEVKQILTELSLGFAQQFTIDIAHISASWRYFEAHHYVVAGTSLKYQAVDSHPIMVGLVAPDFTSTEELQNMMAFIASELSNLTGINKTNIFIEYRCAKSGWVFDKGEIVNW